MRDPRTDPQSGDVLRESGSCYLFRVTRVGGRPGVRVEILTLDAVRVHHPGRAFSLAGWRKIMADAEVVT